MTRVLHILPHVDRAHTGKQANALIAALQSIAVDAYGCQFGHPLRWHLGQWEVLRDQIRWSEPDVIHSWLPSDDWFGLGLLTRFQIPVVATWREVEHWPQGWLTRQASRRAARIVVPTRGIATAYQQRGIDAERLVVIPEWVDTSTTIERHDATSQAGSQFRLRHGLPPHARIVIAMGRWRWEDAWKDLIWTADLLKHIRSDVFVILFSHGEQTTALRRYRDQAEIRDRVWLRASDELPEWLPHAEIAWSMRREPGVSVDLQRAWQQGVNVVATETPCHVEFFRNNSNVLFVPPGDRSALLRQTVKLLGDETLAAGLREPSRLQSAAVDIARQYTELYDHIT